MKIKTETLQQIEALSKNLNEASDQLSQQLAEIESALNAYALGMWAWVPLSLESYEEDAPYVPHLGYGKHEGRWGLLLANLAEDFNSEGYNDGQKFLRDCPREMRLRAVDTIPDLLEALAQRLASTTEEACRKAAGAKEIATALSKKRR